MGKLKDAELPLSQRCCTLSISHGKDGTESTCCGLLIDTRHGIILTHASLLSQMLTSNSAVLRDLKEEYFSQSKQLSRFEVEVLFQKTQVENLEENELSQPLNNKLAPNFLNSELKSSPGFVIHNASVQCIFQCWSLRQVLSKLLPAGSWDFVENLTDVDQGNEKREKRNQNSPEYYSLLPCFLLLKIRNWKPFESVLDVRLSVNNQQGDRVEIQSTPFGSVSPEIFFNCRSQGIISNLSGKNNILILTDARCIPGAEGGALYFCDGKHRVLMGIMIATLCWKNNEWVGLSLAASLSEILDSLNDLPLKWSDDTYYSVNTHGSQWTMSKVIKSVQVNIPHISVNGNWGSGICVGHNKQGQRVILTCSHVIGKGDPTSVEVLYKPVQTPYRADVVYRVPMGQQFDLGILLEQKTSTSEPGIKVRRTGTLRQGESVLVIGHALFGRGFDLEPTVTKGIVSKVIRVRNQPVMIQTTCAVQAGASGGAVVDMEGRLVGLVVCNARDTSTGASYPHINMSVPIATIIPVLDSYIESGDKSVLRSLCVRNPVIHSLWTMEKFKQDPQVLTSKL
ncbi:peroxisomal leader peptide-processing protease-like [Mizuhopecten yessoensis]|nr:peroxisomal leader peptide-processing protease-like [Mizuhopecten yessoensis]XP_021349459.1 peroxisomal leader peptide-processing protease-like [Mizuhopecten yessoensis]XP_021349460.1 peroxisomal leader peptide-processing protease-like [Mizuhopecten yessoensis]